MKTVKIINQGACEYSINQLGNCSYRISYKTDGNRRTQHIDCIFYSVSSAEEYIGSISNSDAAVKKAIDNENLLHIRHLIASSNMTQKAFAEYFNIPLRSIENWCSGSRSCPGYLLQLMQYKLKCEGLIK